MNLENKFSYKKIARFNLAVPLQKTIHSIQFDVMKSIVIVSCHKIVLEFYQAVHSLRKVSNETF